MKKEITIEELNSVKDEYLSDKTNAIIRHMLSKDEMADAVSSQDTNNTQFTFSIDIKTMSVCNQQRSGRCWIFSASTVLREIIAKKLGIKDNFEISQNLINYQLRITVYD